MIKKTLKITGNGNQFQATATSFRAKGDHSGDTNGGDDSPLSHRRPYSGDLKSDLFRRHERQPVSGKEQPFRRPIQGNGNQFQGQPYSGATIQTA